MHPDHPRRWTLAEVAWDVGDDGDEDEQHLYDEEEEEEDALAAARELKSRNARRRTGRTASSS